MSTTRNTEKAPSWDEATARRILREMDKRGLSRSAFARTLNVSSKRLAYWENRLRDQEAEREPPSKSSSLGQDTMFAEVELSVHSEAQCGASRTQALELHTGSDYRLVIPSGFEPETLRQVLGVLREVE